MKQQQRMAIMKYLINKIRSKGRMDAKNRWWVSKLLAEDFEKAWTHTRCEDTMHKWYEWLEYMKKKDEKNEEMHQQKVEKMIKSAEGRAGLLTKPTMWREGVQILEREEGDARLLNCCEAKRKEWSKHWQCNEEIQSMQDKPWRNEELRECEEALPRLKEGEMEKASRLYKANTGVGCDGFRPKVLLDLTKETRGEIAKFLENAKQSGYWPQQACTTMFFLILENVTSERPIALMPTLIRWWEALRAPEVAKWHQKYRIKWQTTESIGTLQMAEMEEPNRRCGKYCWKWKDLMERRRKENEPWL